MLRKRKRKAYNQRMKEKKNQPSAVNQRRMNYEEKQILNKEENKEKHSVDQE